MQGLERKIKLKAKEKHGIRLERWKKFKRLNREEANGSMQSHLFQ
jgi:hypothetical protein